MKKEKKDTEVEETTEAGEDHIEIGRKQINKMKVKAAIEEEVSEVEQDPEVPDMKMMKEEENIEAEEDTEVKVDTEVATEDPEEVKAASEEVKVATEEVKVATEVVKVVTEEEEDLEVDTEEVTMKARDKQEEVTIEEIVELEEAEMKFHKRQVNE